MPLPAGRFFLLLTLGSLALASGYAALVVHTASWEQVRALDAIFPYSGWQIRAFGPAAWQQVRLGLGAAAATLGAAWLALGPGTRAGRAGLAATGAEIRQLLGQLRQQWRALPVGRRRFFALHLLLLTLVRVALSVVMPWADDAVSYEFFVRQRLLAVAAYYPLPNNHVLSNTLAWGLYQLHHGFWWSMRLPVLLTSTVGTLLLFAGLWRRLGYWPALLAAGAMSWAQLSLFHAAAGRGYWLVVVGTALLFFALLALLDAPAAAPPAGGRPRLAWLALVGAGIVGSYAVPTFAYGLVSVGSWLALRAALARRWRLLGRLAAMGLVVALGAGLLYAPLLVVSGPAALLANSYVQRLPAGEFWRGLPAHSWYMEGFLAGQRRVGAVLTVLGLGLFGWLLGQLRRGQLAPALAGPVRAVGLPALWCWGLPWGLLLAQHVLPPERTWLYKAWFFFILVALGLRALREQHPRLATRRRLALGAGTWTLAQVLGQAHLTYQTSTQEADRRAVYAWLQQHPQAGPVLVPDLLLWGWLRFSTHIEHPDQPFRPDQQPQVGVRYAYAVTYRGAPPLPGAGPVVLQAGRLQIARHAAPPARVPPPPPRL